MSCNVLIYIRTPLILDKKHANQIQETKYNICSMGSGTPTVSNQQYENLTFKERSQRTETNYSWLETCSRPAREIQSVSVKNAKPSMQTSRMLEETTRWIQHANNLDENHLNIKGYCCSVGLHSMCHVCLNANTAKRYGHAFGQLETNTLFSMFSEIRRRPKRVKRVHSGAKECLTQPHLRERVNVFSNDMRCFMSKCDGWILFVYLMALNFIV